MSNGLRLSCRRRRREEEDGKEEEEGGGRWTKVERRRRYRGKGRRHRKRNSCTIFLSNLRGFNSKKTSLARVLKDLNPTVLMYNETLLYGKNKVENDGYISFSKNRQTKKGGEVSNSVQEVLKELVVGAGEGVTLGAVTLCSFLVPASFLPPLMLSSISGL